MSGFRRDHGLDTLLDLDGQVYVVDPTSNHWVKFSVKRVEPSGERSHGLSYSLTLHAEDGERLVGFDNAHHVRTSRDLEAECGNSMTTSTGSVAFDPMNIEMPPLYFRISGPKSMPYLKNEE